MTTELLRPGYSNISCTEDQWAFTGALMSTELEVSTEKKDKSIFERTTIIFLTVLLESKENHISIQKEHSVPFQQLLMKEILVNGAWRLDLMVPQRSLLLS